MRGPVSSFGIIGAMMKKDFRLYSRDRVYLVLTVVTIVFIVALFWISPRTVDETITLMVAPAVSTMVADARQTLSERGVPREQLARLEELELAEEGLVLIELESEQQIRQVVEGTLHLYRLGDDTLVVHDPDSGQPPPKPAKRVRPDLGISFPHTFITDVIVGRKPTVTVFASAAVPAEIEGAMQSFVRELAYGLAGQELPVVIPDEDVMILGRDLVGAQPSVRDKLRPALVFFVFLIETYSMASLISTEIARRTVTALLVTPMRLVHFLAAKSIFGFGMAFGQGLIVLALVGAFAAGNPWLLLVTAIIGGLMFTGVAMLIGAWGKDFMAQIMYGLLFTIPMLIPAVSVLFPGSAALWVQALPSYPVIDLLIGTTVYGAGWAESVGKLAYALAWVVLIFGAGLAVLRRKVASL